MKKEFVVDRAKLVSAIRQAEAAGPLANRSVLHGEVARIYNAASPPREITEAVVGLRIKAWELDVTTPIGKKGRTAGVPLTDEQKKAMQAGRKGGRAAKFGADPLVVSGFEQMKREVSPRWSNLVEKARQGSMRAAVALKCIDCSAEQPIEIKFCTCTSCPLYAFRPYKQKPGEEAVEGAEVEDTELEVEEAA